MSDESASKIFSTFFLAVGLNSTSDVAYFIVLALSTGALLKYQLIFGIGVPVAWQVNKAVSPSLSVWSITPTSITGASSQITKKIH